MTTMLCAARWPALLDSWSVCRPPATAWPAAGVRPVDDRRRQRPAQDQALPHLRPLGSALPYLSYGTIPQVTSRPAAAHPRDLALPRRVRDRVVVIYHRGLFRPDRSGIEKRWSPGRS